jgi:4a-hydroxytetrahydrobiopterin dehydratase
MAKLSVDEIAARAAQLPDWEVRADQLMRTFTLASFAHAVIFIGAIAQLAEAANHHPDLLLHDYNQLTVTLTTHSAGGLTEKDFALAARIDALPRKAVK